MLANKQEQQPVFDGLTVTEHAQLADTSIRAINHLTVPPDRARSLTYPQDVWEVVAQLHSIAQRLGQTLKQLDEALEAMAETGRVHGLDEELGTKPLQAAECAIEATGLERKLRTVRDYLGSLSYNVAEDWS